MTNGDVKQIAKIFKEEFKEVRKDLSELKVCVGRMEEKVLNNHDLISGTTKKLNNATNRITALEIIDAESKGRRQIIRWETKWIFSLLGAVISGVVVGITLYILMGN